VNDELKRLVRLQDLMQAVDAVDEEVAAIPAEVARLEKDLLRVQSEVESTRTAIQDLQKERRKLEMELMGVEAKITKYQGQLLEVKTNKEYQTMLHEIDGCRGERAALDEKILVEMEQAEKRNAEIRALEERLKEKRRETEEGKRRLDERQGALTERKNDLLNDQKKLSAEVAPRFLEPFLKVARQRKGVALVAVRDELCGGCHVRVMPKLIQQVRRATGLIACDSCKRFLYVPEEPAAAAGAAPGAAGDSAPR
jgi:uncharacterized protein